MDAGTIAVLLRLTDDLSGPMRQAAQSIDSVKGPAAGAAQALNAVEGQADQAAAALRNVDAPAQQAAQGMSILKASFLGFTLGSVLQQAPQMLAGLGRSTFMAASDMTESLNKVRVVFGESAGEIERFASSAAQNLGLSEQAALAATGTFGNLFVSMGMGTPAASEMSRGIVQLASDLASFNNIPVDVALEKLRAGLVGEVEPLRSLGVNLSAAAVQSKALEMGLADTASALTAADKAQASYALILEQTKTAQGDFARTADGAANSMKTIGAEAQDGAAKVGALLLVIGGPVLAFAANNFGALAAAIGSMLLVALAAATPAMIAFATATWAAMAPFAPFIAAAAALGAAVFLLVKYWDPLVERFPIIQQGVDKVREAFQLLVDFVGGAIPGFMSVVGGLAIALVEWLTLPLEVIAGLGKAMWKLFTGDFEGAWNAAKDTVSGIGASFSNMKDGVEQAMRGVVTAVEGGWDAATAATPTPEELIGPLLLYGPTMAQMTELTRRGKGELTEFASSSEMVADSVARANQNLAYMGEASRLAIQGQQNLNTQWDTATAAVGFWETNLDNAESALDILNRQMEKNGGLSAEQQRQYDILTQATGRYKGGIEDTEGAVVDAAVAQAEFIAKQDELNGLLAAGKIEPADYARAMADLTAETDPAASSTYNMAAAQGDLQNAMNETINKLGNLLIDLGLLPESKRTEFSTPGATEAQQAMDDLKAKADNVPSSLTITAYVDLAQAQNALNELRGMTFTQSPPKKGPMAFVPQWDYLFEGMPATAREYGTAAMETLAGFLPAREPREGPLAQPIDWSWVMRGLDTEAEDYAQRAAEAIAGFLTGIDLDSILDDQADLAGQIANLEAVRDAMAQLGDTQAVEALNAELERLRAEAAALAAIVGTDVVQAWIENENAAKAAAEAQEAALEAQREYAEEQARLAEAVAQRFANAQQSVIEGLAAGGDATASFFDRVMGEYEAAKAAYDLGVLLGVSPEALAQLAERLTEAEVVANEGTRQLREALLAGLIDEETLRALAETGGEWFRALYDQLFGPGALAELEAGWNQIDAVTLERLQGLFETMEDGGASLMQPLIDAVTSGAVSYDEALALLSGATGEQVNEMIAELERLQAALTVQLAEAFLAGTDPSGIEANLAIIEQLLASLADRAVETAETVVRAGKSMGSFADDLRSGLEALDPSAAVAEAERIVRSGGGGALGFNNNPGLNGLDRNGNGMIDPWELPDGPLPPWWQGATPRDWSGTPWGAQEASSGNRTTTLAGQQQINVYLDSQPIATRVERRLLPGRGLTRGVR